jgi:hypothetical protein
LAAIHRWCDHQRSLTAAGHAPSWRNVRRTTALALKAELHPRFGYVGSEPDVARQCTFADVAARDADLAARAASAEFESVRVQMRKLHARFERQVFAIASPDCRSAYAEVIA